MVNRINHLEMVNSINYIQVQVLSYSKYSLLFLPVVGIEPETYRWFHTEALSNQAPHPLRDRQNTWRRSNDISAETLWIQQ